MASRTRTRVFVPGEPKDLLATDGGVWAALYPGGEVWWLADGGEPERVASLPEEHNRPISLASDARTGNLIVTVAADRRGTGAVCMVDPDTGATTVLPHPFSDAAQHPAGLAVHDGIAYVGAARNDPAIVALSLPDGRRRWETRIEGAQTMIGLAVARGRVFGYSPDGWLVALEAADGRIVHREQLPTPGGRLLVAGDSLYGAGRDSLVRIDPEELTWDVALRDLDAAYWNHAFLAADEEYVYTLEGHGVVALRIAVSD